MTRISESNKVRLYAQGKYLVAKIKYSGKQFTISTGQKIVNGNIWSNTLQGYVDEEGNHVKLCEYLYEYHLINEARKDVFKRIATFQLTGNISALKKRRKAIKRDLTTVKQAIQSYKEQTNKNASIVKCLEYQTSNYRGAQKLEDFDIQNFYNSLRVKSSTKNVYINVLSRILFKTTGKSHFIERDKVEDKQPNILTDEVIGQIWNDTGKHAPAIRFLLLTGIRAGELPEVLNNFKANPELTKLTYVMPKTKKQRQVFLTPKIRHELEQITNTKYKTIWKYFNDNYKINLHQLRATFITKKYRDGHKLELISKTVGHSSPTVTFQKYLRFEDDDLATIYD